MHRLLQIVADAVREFLLKSLADDVSLRVGRATCVRLVQADLVVTHVHQIDQADTEMRVEWNVFASLIPT